MSKKVTKIQKIEIKELFLNGISIKEISDKLNFSIQTITRQLKIILGENEFKKLKDSSVSIIKGNLKKLKAIPEKKINIQGEENFRKISKEEYPKNFEQNSFEVLPFFGDVVPDKQKELSSIPISEINFPNTLFMIVDKKIELEIKLLRDFPDWQFLPKEDLDRKTIEIFDDIKLAKRYCNKDQKVIKVPNTDVFKITAPILLSRGISRIVRSDQLIAL